jgi:hypothetical protein
VFASSVVSFGFDGDRSKPRGQRSVDRLVSERARHRTTRRERVERRGKNRRNLAPIEDAKLHACRSQRALRVYGTATQPLGRTRALHGFELWRCGICIRSRIAKDDKHLTLEEIARRCEFGKEVRVIKRGGFERGMWKPACRVTQTSDRGTKVDRFGAHDDLERTAAPVQVASERSHHASAFARCPKCEAHPDRPADQRGPVLSEIERSVATYALHWQLERGRQSPRCDTEHGGCSGHAVRRGHEPSWPGEMAQRQGDEAIKAKPIASTEREAASRDRDRHRRHAEHDERNVTTKCRPCDPQRDGWHSEKDKLARGEPCEEPVRSIGVGGDADTNVGVAGVIEAAHPSAPIPARTTR